MEEPLTFSFDALMLLFGGGGGKSSAIPGWHEIHEVSEDDCELLILLDTRIIGVHHHTQFI